MLSLFRVVRIAAVTLVAAIMLVGAAAPSRAQSGTVRLHIVKAGFIVGVGGGSGVLHFQGRNYPLSVGGASVATLQNQNGVVLTLRGVQAGFQVSLGLGGMTISMR